jgi:hypothetical protein
MRRGLAAGIWSYRGTAIEFSEKRPAPPFAKMRSARWALEEPKNLLEKRSRFLMACAFQQPIVLL